MHINPAVAPLKRLLSTNALASGCEAFLNYEIRQQPSWYTKLKDKEGAEQAEAELSQWVRDSKMFEFASSIEPVAKGMLAMAEMDGYGDFVFLGDCDQVSRTFKPSSSRSQSITVLNNRCCFQCPRLSAAELWAMSGRVELKAVSLQFEYGFLPGEVAAQLALVLPAKGPNRMDGEFGHTIVTFNLSGRANGQTSSIKPSQEGYWKFAAGISPLEHAFYHRTFGGGHLDSAIGFPGATNFFADSLASLGPYLEDLANGLRPHKH